jgi:hypothetical protein
MHTRVRGRLSHNMIRPARCLPLGGSGKDRQRKCGEDQNGWNLAIHGITSITTRGFNASEPIADTGSREYNLRQLATEPLVAAL